MVKSSKKPVAVLVGELGGAQEVAAKLGTTPEAVKMWAWRNAVPRARWPELLDAFPTLTMDDLRAVERAGKAA